MRLCTLLKLEADMPSRDFKRTDRVSAELRREIGLLVHAAVRDHALPSVSVSDVEVTRDLDWATVWVTALMPEKSAEAVKGLKELAPEFRRLLSRSMRLRRVPELKFKYDESVDTGERIERLLRENPVPPVDPTDEA
jgi:ribosome-binding factor A